MAYNILGINPGHNGSVALVSDGVLVYYVEEERLSKQKYDANPFKGILDVVSKYPVDEMVIVGTTLDLPKLPWTGEDPYTELVRKFYPDVKTSCFGHEHHATHAACAFYNSGFDKALCIVVDGAGSLRQETIDSQVVAEGFETESIWSCEYPANINLVYRTLGANYGNYTSDGVFEFSNATTITKSYEAVSQYLGFGFIEAGKTMGLAPYGEHDPKLPKLFNKSRGSKDVFIPYYPAGAFIDQNTNEYLAQYSDPQEWHTDATKLTAAQKNLAWQIQHDTQQLVGDLVQRALDTSECKNVTISGGYGLNCVCNYYLAKRFPDVNFYFEPISNDGGTAIGAAKVLWYLHSNETTTHPQTSVYYGPEYDLNYIKQYIESLEDYTITSVTYADVAKLIADRNIVALYQGRSEAGPRALGNRSILYDPRDPSGKDFVNVVKGREWFRPFAGTVLESEASNWFDLAGKTASPFMMMAVDIYSDKLNSIPAVAHVDGTCRVQTVNVTENKHYYNLISAFKDITQVPVLFNTSFNLAGDPLVETIEDAISTINRSELKYLYLPELDILVSKEQ